MKKLLFHLFNVYLGNRFIDYEQVNLLISFKTPYKYFVIRAIN